MESFGMKVIILLSRSPSPGREIRNGTVTERILSDPRSVELVLANEEQERFLPPNARSIESCGGARARPAATSMIPPLNFIPRRRKAEALFALLIGLLDDGPAPPGKGNGHHFKAGLLFVRNRKRIRALRSQADTKRRQIKTWVVQWGDGSQTRQAMGTPPKPLLSHTYGNAGVYSDFR